MTFSSPMKHAIDAGPARLVDEVGDAVALGVDLDDQGHLDALVLLELDQPVEEVLPVLVAGHVVVGDEERRDALLVVLADDRFEIVGIAEAALAALHVDDGAERALERAAAAEIEARLAAFVAGERRRRQAGRRRAFDARQIVHVVVERLQRAVPGIEQDRVEPAFLGLAGEDRDAHVHGRPGSPAARPAASTGSPAAWKPPIATGRPALRNWRARSTARGNWLDCTPTRQISALPPLRLMSATMRSGAHPRCWSRRTA